MHPSAVIRLHGGALHAVALCEGPLKAIRVGVGVYKNLLVICGLMFDY